MKPVLLKNITAIESQNNNRVEVDDIKATVDGTSTQFDSRYYTEAEMNASLATKANLAGSATQDFSAKNMTVAGNLSVSGTTTTVNSETINLADNMITLNSNFTGSTPTEDAGIEVNRGTAATKKFYWDESADSWSADGDPIVVHGEGGHVGMTMNDGGGNANIVFNHRNQKPDENGNAARITVNVDDATNANMSFQIAESVTKDQSTGTNSVLVLRPSSVDAYKPLKEEGTLLSAKYLGIGAKAVDSDKLDGMQPATAATANTIAQRDASGDFTARYVNGSYMKMSHAASARNADTVFYSSTDNFIRKNTAAGMRTALSLYTKAEVDTKVANAGTAGFTRSESTNYIDFNFA